MNELCGDEPSVDLADRGGQASWQWEYAHEVARYVTGSPCGEVIDREAGRVSVMVCRGHREYMLAVLPLRDGQLRRNSRGEPLLLAAVQRRREDVV